LASLYIIASPIGNLGDLSPRALEALKNAALIACEDTRRTLGLLSHFNISKKLLSCRAQNEERAAEKVINLLASGADAAYLSDAGTPALSDPGAVLVRKAAAAGHKVIPIPGPSAFASILSVSGAQDKTVVFEGFLSVKAGKRRTRLKELLDGKSGFVLYESPYRVLKLFDELVLLAGKRYVCAAREMTKIHEEYLRGTAEEVREFLLQREKNGTLKGEFSVYVSAFNG